MSAKQALGRGLKALMPEAPRARTGLVEVELDRIRPNPHQPRHHFDEQSLHELAASIREHGLLQPVVVGEDGSGGYRLIAGERRWRAAAIAGLARIPAVIRERVTEERELELALVENLQRRDLTPMEEARAFEQLRSGLGLAQAEIAQRVGIDRSTVANALRLLKLPTTIQEMVEAGALSAGHARALLAFADDEDRLRWAERTVAAGLSVRELERAAAESREMTKDSSRRAAGKRAERDPNLMAAEEKLSLHLGARVEINSSTRGGRIVIHCGDHGELMRVFDLLLGVDDGPGE